MLDQASINSFRSQVIPPQNHLIDGSWVNASESGTRDVQSPIDRKLLTTIAEGLKIGDPLSLNNNVGAVHHETQLAANLEFVTQAESEGATRLTGGERILEETGGTYMSPAVLDNVAPTAKVFQKEVFGAVLAVTPFDTIEEAIQLANATDFGLSGAVWTSNVSTAHRVTKGIKSGMLHVNTYGGSDVTIPMGGIKQSGNEIDKSVHALDKYVDLKSVWMKI